MMKTRVLALAALVLTTGLASAQTPPAASAPDPGNMGRFGRAIKQRFDNIRRDIVEAADAVPESEYAFKPTPQVRSFGELIGHITDSHNFFCGVAAGSNPEYADANEKETKGKAALVAALKTSVAKCDSVYGSTDAKNALDLVTFGKGDGLRGMILLDNVAHDNEHYGNIVTYMRLKGHVPPSTARGGD